MRIAFIGTGGTISNAGTGQRDYLTYLDGGRVLDVEDVLRKLPDVSDLAQVVPIAFRALRSKAIGVADWLELHATIQTALNDCYDGVVITHGTGTLEETSFFLHLTLGTDAPVVVVGAQRPPDTVSSDAQLNVIDAVRTAASPLARGLGTLVVMNQTVHSARDVTKAMNHGLSAMHSPVGGPLGHVRVDGSLELIRTPLRRHTMGSEFTSLPADGALPRVDIVTNYAGADDTSLNAFLEAGARGIVLVGFAPGTNTPAIDAAIGRAIAAGVTVVQATRAYHDPRVLARPGLSDQGVLAGGSLSPHHTRILLQLCLANGLRHEDIARVLTEY